jgi:hypothetical protein
MGKKSPECHKLEKKLFVFFSKEKATKKPIVSFHRVYQKTSKTLGVSYTSVHRIMNGKQWRSLGQIDPKKELKFLTTLIIMLLKEQSTVYIHGKLLRPSQ